MQVILKQDVKGSGKAGELVKVSDGYAKNYLFKKGLAVPASAAALNEKETRDAAVAHHHQVELDNARAVASKLDGKTVTVSAKAGANGKFFGSVTAKEIAEEIQRDFGMAVDKKKIALDGDVKSFGSFSFEVKLHTGVSAKMILVVKEA